MKRVVKISLIVLLALFCAAVIGFGIFLLSVPSIPLDTKMLEGIDNVTRYIDSTGTEIKGVYMGKNASYVPYSQLSANTVDAFVCTEDKRFFVHGGVDYKRMVSALFANIGKGAAAQGASTITQQLAKNTHLSNEKTLKRKIQEIRLAKELERTYTKEEIMEMYLNVIYFGHNVYGIESAARAYFDTTADRLTVDQSASLAAIINAPAKYSPINHQDVLLKRRNLVLKNMSEQKKISNDVYFQAVNEPIKISMRRDPYSYYLLCAREEAKSLNALSSDLAGCTIYTGYDERTQSVLDRSLSQSADYRYKGVISDNTGLIIASSSNDTTTVGLKRQPGSAIKPLSVYAPAVERGILTAATPLEDVETDFGGYKPRNYGGGHSGWISARQALSTSNNIAAVKAMEMTGVDYCYEFSSKLGLPVIEKDKNLPLALGGMTYGVRSEDLVGGYACIGNNGSFLPASYVQRIENINGETIYRRPMFTIPTMAEETAELVRDMMITCAKTGTASKLGSLPYQIAAKTGTVGYLDSEKNTDAYCVGMTTDNVFSFWIGGGATEEEMLPTTVRGGTLPAAVARTFCEEFYVQQRPSDFSCRLQELRLDADALRNDHLVVEAPPFLQEKDIIREKFGAKLRPARAHIVRPTLKISKENDMVKLDVSGDRYADYQVIRYTQSETTVLPIGKLINGGSTIYDSDDHGLLWIYRLLALYPDGSQLLTDPVRMMGIAYE